MTDLHFPEMRGNPAARGARSGVLASWLAADGSRVCVGQRLAEVRLAGAAGWVSALATGTLWHQVEEGEVLAVGSVVGLIE